jgi:hypothetical protein
MIPATLRRPTNLAALALGAGLVLAGCTGSSSSASPSTAVGSAPSPAPIVTPATSAAPSAAPNPAGSVGPSTSPAASTPASTTACVMPPTAVLPSDRFTQVQLIPGGTADGLRFIFGNSSLPGPPSPPMGSVSGAVPPYTQAGSGEAIEVNGQHVLQLKFEGMSIQNDVGQPVYDGPTKLSPGLPAIKDAALYDASEGVVGWYIGYDGAGCPTLARDGQGLVLTIPHG